MAIILSNICILRTILLFTIVPQWHDIRAVALCYPITWATTALCMFLYYKQYGTGLVLKKFYPPGWLVHKAIVL